MHGPAILPFERDDDLLNNDPDPFKTEQRNIFLTQLANQVGILEAHQMTFPASVEKPFGRGSERRQGHIRYWPYGHRFSSPRYS